MRKVIYSIQCPRRFRFGNPLYFEEFKGDKLASLVADYEPSENFVAKAVLQEQAFDELPGFMERNMILYMAPQDTLDTYVQGYMYEGQQKEEKAIGVDTAKYLIDVDGRYEEIRTGGDGYWGSCMALFRGNGKEKVLDAVIVDIGVSEFESFDSMRKWKNEYTYPPYERTQEEELLQCLRSIAPYIIIDCGSYIANDIPFAIALMEADAVLRLINCDLKSISYLSSQLPLLKENKWDAEKQYKLASNVYPNEASEHIERVLVNVTFQIPHSEEVKAQVLEGSLFKELGLKDSKGFRKSMESITKEVFRC